MFRRRPMYLFAILAFFATTLFAADPFVGTWKMDPAKSKHSGNGPNPKELTLVIEEQGDNYRVTATGTNADGSPLSGVKYTVPIKGGTAKIEDGGGLFDSMTSKSIGANQRLNTYTKDGKDAGKRRLVLAKDGKTLTTTFKGKDAQGNPVTSVQVLNKQ